jgi:hypothetical protein
VRAVAADRGEGEADRAKNGAGAAADAKETSIVGGMVVGSVSIDDLDVRRHGAMPTAFGGVRAPSMLGTFLNRRPTGQPALVELRDVFNAFAPEFPRRRG